MSLVTCLIRRFTRNWVHRPPTEKKEGYVEKFRSKNALKLMELNERYRIFKPGQRVLDLGAAPGGWTEVAVSATESKKESPTVFCVDIQSMIRIDGSLSIVSDLTEEECHNTLLNFVKSPVDVILNDMSIFTSRDRDIDCETQWSFCLDALRISNLLLKPGGLVLFKMYLGLEEPKHFVRSN